jgi:hypothetical protein
MEPTTVGNWRYAKNKLASEGKLLEADKAEKTLQQWHDEQKEQWENGTLDYDMLAPCLEDKRKGLIY